MAGALRALAGRPALNPAAAAPAQPAADGASMRIAFLGTGDFAVPALRRLHTAGHALVVVISQPDRAAGRGRAVQPTPVRAAALELGLRHVPTADINGLPPADLLSGADIGVVAAFGQKLGPALLGAVPRGFVNIHGSLLPKYRGAAPYQWAILSGETVTGVTIFQLNERWDAGSVWASRETPIDPRETADELHDRLALLGAAAIVDVLPAIAAGRLEPRTQDAQQATRAPKLRKSDGYVDWSATAAEVVRRIHGLWSWPAVACAYVGRDQRRERLLLARAEIADGVTPVSQQWRPGAFHLDRTIQAGIGRVRLLEVKPAGKSLMPFAAFANGRAIAPPDRLDAPEADI